MLFFANLFGHFFGQRESEIHFPKYSSKRAVFRKKNPKTIENSLIPLLKLETKVR